VIDPGKGPDKDMLQLVDSLRSGGYKTAMLSNFGKLSALKLRESGVTSHFDVAHFSGDTGFAKPQPEAFLNLADELGIHVSQLIFIDDSEYCLNTAEITGYHPILFINRDQMIASLKQYEVQTLEY
jgi:putative hydrolase of the HAD superfamily